MSENMEYESRVDKNNINVVNLKSSNPNNSKNSNEQFLEKNIILDSLAARQELDEDSNFYLNVLDDAINDPRNKNIALTGGYGAGKSTIINTYINDFSDSDEEIIKVSIAKFENKSGEDESSAIEKQILQQIIHQIDAKKIPGSRFIKFSELGSWQRWSRLIGFIFLNIFLMYLIFGGVIGNFLQNELEIKLSVLSTTSLIILGTIILTLYIYFFTFLFQKFKISKFGIASSHIEFNLDDDSVYFNDYFSDIVYLFKKTDYKILIFEDLDRFNSIEIFEKLRMLNINLNKSHHLKNKEITFIYALKDDVFSNTDDESFLVRTKFFDIVVPTINVLHSENFKEYIRENIGEYIEEHEHEKFERLIDDISLFVTDMRTLINICNEFKIYKERLRKSKLLNTEILPFIIYKNIYPVDFSHLLKNEGLLFEIFNDKSIYTEDLLNRKEKIINAQAISRRNLIENKEEMLLLFFKKLPPKYRNKSVIYNNNIIGTFQDVSQNNLIQSSRNIFDFFEKDDKNLEVYIKNGLHGELIEKLDNKESFFIIKGINYLKYYSEIESKNKKELNEELNRIDKALDTISRNTIYQLIKDNMISLPEELKRKELLYYLISHNWINESYNDLLSGFMEGDLKTSDREFLKSVKIGSNEDYLLQKLTNPLKVLTKINLQDINSSAIINNDLVKVLIEKIEDDLNRPILKRIIEVIYERDGMKNLVRLLESLDEDERYIFLDEVSSDYLWFNDMKDFNMVDLSWYTNLILNKESISEKIGNTSFSLFIEEKMNLKFLENKKELEKSLIILGVKFKKLNKPIEEDVLTIMKKNQLYEINLINFTKFIGDKISYEFVFNDKYLQAYVNLNIEEFIKEVLMKQKKYTESVEFLCKLTDVLISENQENNLSKLIEKWDGEIQQIKKEIPLLLIQKSLEVFKVKATWNNILFLLENDEIDNELIEAWLEIRLDEFINNSNKAIQNYYNEKEKIKNFVIKISEFLSIKNLDRFIKKLDVRLAYSDLDNSILLEKLICHNNIHWDINNYKTLEENELKILYIKNNLEESESDFEKLIHEGDLPWIVEVSERISGNNELLAKYMVGNKRLLKVEQEVFESILNASDDSDYLFEIYIKNNQLKLNGDSLKNFAHKLYELDGEQFILNINENLSLFLNVFEAEDTAKLLLTYLKNREISRQGIYDILSELENPFRKVKLFNPNILISSFSNEQVSLFDYLVSQKVLAKKYIEGGEIKYTNKRKLQ